MIDLTDVSGLQVKFDESKGVFYFPDGIHFERSYFVPLSEIIPILLNKSLKYPEVVYSCNCNVKEKETDTTEHVTYDLMYIPSGLLGIEYVKTHVYYTENLHNKVDCIIEVLSGDLTVVMQKNGESDVYDFEQNTIVEEISVINLSKGNRLVIPTGFMYTFINTGLTPLLIAKISTKHWKPLNYTLIKKEKGLACFVISKNARVEAVANPRYKLMTKLKVQSYKKFMQSTAEVGSWHKVYTELNNTTPIYFQRQKLNHFFNR